MFLTEGRLDGGYCSRTLTRLITEGISGFPQTHTHTHTGTLKGGGRVALPLICECLPTTYLALMTDQPRDRPYSAGLMSRCWVCGCITVLVYQIVPVRCTPGAVFCLYVFVPLSFMLLKCVTLNKGFGSHQHAFSGPSWVLMPACLFGPSWISVVCAYTWIT